jgi:hypothetical protein
MPVSRTRVSDLREPASGEPSPVVRREEEHVGENAVLRTVVEILLSRDADIVAAHQGKVLRYEDEAAGIPVWKRMKENCVDGAEYGRVGADSKGKSQQAGDGKAWRFTQLTCSVSQIRPNGFERGQLPYFAAALFDHDNIAELTASGAFGLCLGHHIIHQIGNLFFEVFADRFREFVIPATTREQSFEPLHTSPPTIRQLPERG